MTAGLAAMPAGKRQRKNQIRPVTLKQGFIGTHMRTPRLGAQIRDNAMLLRFDPSLTSICSPRPAFRRPAAGRPLLSRGRKSSPPNRNGG